MNRLEPDQHGDKWHAAGRDMDGMIADAGQLREDIEGWCEDVRVLEFRASRLVERAETRAA